jgi:hypothetical protein
MVAYITTLPSGQISYREIIELKNSKLERIQKEVAMNSSEAFSQHLYGVTEYTHERIRYE